MLNPAFRRNPRTHQIIEKTHFEHKTTSWTKHKKTTLYCEKRARRPPEMCKSYRKEFNNDFIINKSEIEYVEEYLDNAVKSQLLSDVPLGSFLSGGVDSPLISYYAKKNSSGSFNTFCMGSDSSTHDESLIASQFADSLETIHHSNYMNAGNSLEALDKSVSSA